MASVTQQVQVSYATFLSRSVSHNKGLELKRFATTLHRIVQTDRFPALRCKSCLSVRAPLVGGRSTTFFRIAAFESSANNDEAGSQKSGSNSAKLSCIQQESNNTFTQSTERQVERSSGSIAIHNLFNNWLTLLLKSPPPNKVIDEALEGKISMVPDLVLEGKKGNILTVIWAYLWDLDAAVKVPVLLLTPLYLAVNVIYGIQVSKELAPLWIFGPLIIALYVKLFQGICALYVLTFKQTVRVVKNSPAYYVMAYNYIAHVKLKEEIYVHLLEPGRKLMYKNHKEFSVKKIKALQLWAVEKYLDCLEFIWPTYCRTIRFLKRENLI